MNQELITIEKRKLDWLMRYCDQGLEDANKFFDRIDNIMPTLRKGDKLYKFESSNFDTQETTYNELEILQIVDYDNGIILVKGKGFWKGATESVERNENINYLYTKEEISKSKYILK